MSTQNANPQDSLQRMVRARFALPPYLLRNFISIIVAQLAGAAVGWCAGNGQLLATVLAIGLMVFSLIALADGLRLARSNDKVSDGGPLTHESKQDANPPFAAPTG